jgi:hypothetical protein
LDGDDIQAVLKLFSDSLETPSDHFTVH